MKYYIVWRDGTVTEDLDFDESQRLIKERPTEWGGVRPLNYGQDCDPENERLRKTAWGTK